MPRRREVPFDPTMRAPQGREVACAAAETDTQALMEARPFEDPQPSRAALLPLRDVIQDAMDRVLTPRESWIFDACVVERQSIRSLAADLSLAKSHVHRIKDVARTKLRAALQDEPLILSYLERSVDGFALLHEPTIEEDDQMEIAA